MLGQLVALLVVLLLQESHAVTCFPFSHEVVSVDHHETLHVLARRLLASKQAAQPCPLNDSC